MNPCSSHARTHREVKRLFTGFYVLCALMLLAELVLMGIENAHPHPIEERVAFLLYPMYGFASFWFLVLLAKPMRKSARLRMPQRVSGCTASMDRSTLTVIGAFFFCRVPRSRLRPRRVLDTRTDRVGDSHSGTSTRDSLPKVTTSLENP